MQLSRLRGAVPAAMTCGLVLALLSFASSAAEISRSQMQALLKEFGKEALVEVLLEMRHGQMTVKVGNSMVERWGRQRLDAVDVRTLMQDASVAKVSAKSIREAVTQRRARAELQVVSRTPGEVPLAWLGRTHVLQFGDEIAYSVADLIDDAKYRCARWPDALNDLRQGEAARRNRRIDTALQRFQFKHGTINPATANRRAIEKGEEMGRQCRSLKEENGGRFADVAHVQLCDTAQDLRRGTVERNLRTQLRGILENFESEMRRHDQRHLPRPAEQDEPLGIRSLNSNRALACTG